jgi:hypothetical protein
LCLLDRLPTPCANAFPPTCYCERFSKLSKEKARQSLIQALAPYLPGIASSLRSSQ